MTAVRPVNFRVSPGDRRSTVLLLGWVEQGQSGNGAAMGTAPIVSMLLTIVLVLALARRFSARMVDVER